MKKVLTFSFSLVIVMMSLRLWAVNDYLNEYSVPVGVNVPYYPEGSLVPKRIDIVLQPGDLYKGNIGKNGFIYEQYGLMPKIAENLINNNSTNVVVSWSLNKGKNEEEYEKYIDGLAATNMPDWWIKKYQSIYSRNVQEAQTYSISAYSFLTNIHDRINELTDPDSDPDGDSFSNRTEFYCGSNPWRENDVIAFPRFVRIVPEGGTMATGVFHIVNHSKSNLFCSFENALIRSKEKRYRPYLFDNKGKSIDAGIEVSGESTNKIYCLIKDKFFPRRFDDCYQISVSVTNSLIGEIQFYTPGNYSHPLTKPTNLTPKAGSCIEPGEKLRCSWRDEGNRDISWYQIVNKYQIQVLGLNNKFPKSTYIEEKKPILLMDERDWIYNRPEPGNYIWRVNKQNQFSDPISSEWSWFNVGREVAPQKAKGRGSDQARIEGRNGAEVVFAVTGKEYDLGIGPGNASRKSHFLRPLQKNQKVYYQTNGWRDPDCFHISGVFEKTGVYTNTWFSISSEGKTNNSLYVFVVRNPSNEKNVRSFYYLEDKTITHDLFVNVPFEYKERKFFETFLKKDDLIWDKDLKMEFSDALPKGLSVNRTKEGDDLEIKGVPLEEGVFKLDLVFSNARRQVKEKHVFRIKDIGEPAFEIENRLQGPKEKRTGFYIEDGKNTIVHTSYVGIDFKYPVYCETYPRYNWLEDYWRFVKNVKIGFIGDVPPGLTVGDIPFCTNYSTKAETTAVGFIGEPSLAGRFTNFVVLAEKDFVVTNKHVFVIKKDLD